MSWLIEIALGICLIILVVGLVNVAQTYAAGRSRREKAKDADRIEAQLDEIERRLTDVQDVMISLSEKFDRWEGKRIRD